MLLLFMRYHPAQEEHSTIDSPISSILHVHWVHIHFLLCLETSLFYALQSTARDVFSSCSGQIESLLGYCNAHFYSHLTDTKLIVQRLKGQRSSMRRGPNTSKGSRYLCSIRTRGPNSTGMAWCSKNGRSKCNLSPCRNSPALPRFDNPYLYWAWACTVKEAWHYWVWSIGVAQW